MKKTIVFISIAALLFINAINIVSGFNNDSNDNVVVKEALAFVPGGSNCWSQYTVEEGSGVLKCVTCDWQDDATGDGRHDGTCP